MRAPWTRRCAGLLLLAIGLMGASCRSAEAASPPQGTSGSVFLTFRAEDTSRALSVRYVSPTPLVEPSILVRGPDDEATRAVRVTMTSRPVHGRQLLAFDLEGLLPATRYAFVLKDEGRALTKERAFRTLPDDERTVVLATGGDVGVSAMSRALLRAVAKTSPDVLALGGDLAYGNGEPEAAPLWDLFLAQLDEALVTSDGRMIPIVFAIGNHEVRGSFMQPPAHAPFFYGYTSDVQDEDRAEETSFVRALGKNASLLALDSAHIQSHAAQARFIDEALERSSSRPFTFALYHVPLFPSVRPFDREPSGEGRAAWLPLFDKHRLTAAFENHDHALKRTLPLIAGAPAAGGTLYLGDGCLGQSERPALQAAAPYLAKAAGDSHFWRVEISSERVVYRALDEDLRTLDEAVSTRRVAAASAAPPSATPSAAR